MGILFFAVAACILAVGLFFSNHVNEKRMQQMFLHRFGKKPEPRDYNFDEIKIFWQELKEDGCPGNVDDTTWDDLNMDEVFSRINMCCSSVGEQYLYKSLRNTNFCEADMYSLEEKTAYLGSNEAARAKVQKRLLRIGKRRTNYYLMSFLKNLDTFRLDRIWLYYVLQILLFTAIVLAVVFRNHYAWLLLGISFLVNLVVYACMKNKYEVNMDLMVSIQSILQTCRAFAKEKEDPVFYVTFKEYTGTIKDLTRSMALINGRHQRRYTADFTELCASYLTGAFLFDFVFYNRAVTKLKEKLPDLLKLVNLLGETDLAVSVASFRQSVPSYCLPEFGEECRIYYEALYHPLIDDPVCNNLNLDAHCIITGSNASGKSTFIKAVAINEILAAGIHTCTAKTARIPGAELYTSMAVRDDLLAGESYFVREIKSLQRIIDIIDRGRFAIAVIDEILRGTNTRERIAASAAILKYLEKKNCILIVASHDIELIDLLDSSNYYSFYFCESSQENGVTFDYKLRQGICRENNAIKLLDSYGFPKAVVKAAKEYSAPGSAS